MQSDTLQTQWSEDFEESFCSIEVFNKRFVPAQRLTLDTQNQMVHYLCADCWQPKAAHTSSLQQSPAN